MFIIGLQFMNFVKFLFNLAYSIHLLTKQEFGMNLFCKSICIFAVLFINFEVLQAQKVHIVEYESQADIKVYVVDYESQCDLKVYVVEYESRANKDGRWYFEEYSSQADKKIYFVDYESQSDLKIYYVEYESMAGWKNLSKQHLLK